MMCSNNTFLESVHLLLLIFILFSNLLSGLIIVSTFETVIKCIPKWHGEKDVYFVNNVNGLFYFASKFFVKG